MDGLEAGFVDALRQERNTMAFWYGFIEQRLSPFYLINGCSMKKRECTCGTFGPLAHWD